MPDKFSDRISPAAVTQLLSKSPQVVVDPTKIVTPWMLAPEAAAYIKRKPGTLAQMRFYGRGPKYYSDGGKVVYLQSDLDEWMRLGNERRVGTKGRGKGRGRPKKLASK